MRDGASQTQQTLTSHRDPLRRVGPIYSREVTGVWDQKNGCHRRPGGGGGEVGSGGRRVVRRVKCVWGGGGKKG